MKRSGKQTDGDLQIGREKEVGDLQADRAVRGTRPGHVKGVIMRSWERLRDQTGKLGYLLLWLLGIPIPILILIFLIRGCT
jgi:hypothetical protein